MGFQEVLPVEVVLAIGAIDLVLVDGSRFEDCTDGILLDLAYHAVKVGGQVCGIDVHGLDWLWVSEMNFPFIPQFSKTSALFFP